MYIYVDIHTQYLFKHILFFTNINYTCMLLYISINYASSLIQVLNHFTANTSWTTFHYTNNEHTIHARWTQPKVITHITIYESRALTLRINLAVSAKALLYTKPNLIRLRLDETSDEYLRWVVNWWGA